MQSQNQPPVPSVVSPPVDKDKLLAILTEMMQEAEEYYMTLPLVPWFKKYLENLKNHVGKALELVTSNQSLTLKQPDVDIIKLIIELAQQADKRDYIRKLKDHVKHIDKEGFLEPIPDPLLKIPHIEEEKDDLLVDCISLSTMFDPVAASDGFVYEKESIVDFFNMNIEAKEIRSPKTNLPFFDRLFTTQYVVAMLIKRKMEENPFLLHDQALPVMTMKKAIEDKDLAEVGRLLDKDIIGRFLANDEVIHCVNEACSIKIFTLFKNKMKNNAKEQKKIFETLLTIVMKKVNIPLLVELLELNPHYDPDIISRVQKKIKNQTSNLEMMANLLSDYQQVSDPEDKPSFSLSSSSSFVSSQLSDGLMRMSLLARPDNESKSSQIPVDPMRSLYESPSSESHLTTNSFSANQNVLGRR